ncbi:MAG: Flp family type IVb pilin [Desulfuromonadaceae bacterium]
MRNLISMYVKMQSMLKDEKGATMVEYALMVALIAVVVAIAVGPLGEAIAAKFTSIKTTLG